jgi:hypothetical protein
MIRALAMKFGFVAICGFSRWEVSFRAVKRSPSRKRQDPHTRVACGVPAGNLKLGRGQCQTDLLLTVAAVLSFAERARGL